MGRASNPGAPQRVSAHVLPKASAFSNDDEDEKTTIESGGWEEEASTTVEQGDVLEKVRALGLGLDQAKRPNTGVTSTNGQGMSDEPTVDDQRANAALAMLSPPIVARLMITDGNDAGQTLEVRPGKTYTIGRGIDNDLVLSDIAVSRKHFDLRSENGAWVLADRGSGNGTLVNNRLEDAPFMLASGDVIEIGNTAFRFEQPNGTPRAQATFDSSSQVNLKAAASGQPLGEGELATPLQSAPPPQISSPVSRPKTLPPPAPLPRPRASTSRPPGGFALDRPSQPLAPDAISAALAPTLIPAQSPALLLPSLSPPQPQTTLPLPQMANRPPLASSGLLDPQGSPPSTLPGQGPPMQPAHPARLPFSYPSGEIPRQPSRGGPRGSMIVASAQPGRDATSTALVPPMSYSNGQPVIVPQPPYHPPPELSRRMKMALGAAGIALFAAVATIAIVKGSSGGGGGSAGDAASPAKPTSVQDLRPGAATPATRDLLRDARPTKPIKAVDSPGAKAAPIPSPAITPATATPPTVTPAVTPATVSPPAATPSASTPPASTPPASTPPASTPPASTPPASTPPASAPSASTPSASTPSASTPSASTPSASTPPAATKPSVPMPGTTSPGLASTPSAPPPGKPAPTAPVIATADKPAPVTPRATATPILPETTSPAITPGSSAATTAVPSAIKADKITAPVATRPPVTPAATPAVTAPADKRVARKPEKKIEKKIAAKNDAARVDVDKPETAAPPPKKRAGRTTQDVKNDAAVLYRRKDFNGAAALVSSAAASFSAGDSQDLKNLGAIYSQLGKAYNVGMAPGTKFTDAYVALRRAANYDREVGAGYLAEIQDRLVLVASRAAMSYMAVKDYEQAFQAVRLSDSLGSSSPSNKTVRDKLDELAIELYRAAQSELASDPDAAKRKLHQVQGMIDPKNPVYAKATKLLNGS